MPEAKKSVRWRERQLSDPQGMAEVRHPLVRIVEGANPPDGAEIVQDPPHDWKVDLEKP